MKKFILRRTLRVGLACALLSLGLGASSISAEVVAVVSTKSPISTLSKGQIIDIFLGRRTHYPDGTLAVPIDQTEGSAERNEFYNKIADMSAAQVKAFWSKIIFTGRGQPPLAAATSLETRKLLAANPNAISYIDQSLVDSSLRVVIVR